MIILAQENDDVFIEPPTNSSSNDELSHIYYYVNNLLSELQKLRQLNIEIHEMYQGLSNIMEQINGIKLNLDKRNKCTEQDNQYAAEINSILDKYKQIHNDIINLSQSNNPNIKYLASLLNVEIEKFNYQLLTKNSQLQKENNDMKKQLEILKNTSKDNDENITQLTSIINRIFSHISNISTKINNLKSYESMNRDEKKYYNDIIEKLLDKVNRQSNQTEEFSKIINIKSEEINNLNDRLTSINNKLGSYKTYKETDTMLDETIKYIINIYQNIYKAENLQAYIRDSDLSSSSKSYILTLLSLIKEDQYIKNMNMKIIAYINRTNEFKNQLSKEKLPPEQIISLINQYNVNIEKLSLKGPIIDKNTSLINIYRDKISHKKYNNSNLELDTSNLCNSIKTTYIDDLKLDVEYINITHVKQDTEEVVLQNQINALLNLIIYFKILDYVTDKKTFEANLDKYNFYIKLSCNISKHKYDPYEKTPNNEVLANIGARTTRYIKECINIIGKNSKEHSDLIKIGIKLSDILEESPNITISKVQPHIQKIESIIYKKFKKLDSHFLSILKKIDNQEITTIIELFENQV